MKFKFRVYYNDGIPISWADTAKYKIINARNKRDAEKKFKEKYPYYRVAFVETE